jgi:hypothetical protein
MTGLDGVRVCGVPDHVGAGRVCQWPDTHLPYTILDLPPGVTEVELRAALQWAFSDSDGWSGVCGIEPVYEESARKARLLITTASMDGPSGVLADCMLPCGNISQALMRLDRSEAWTTNLIPSQRQIVLAKVLRHEAGHGLGLGHAPDGSQNWMAPMYSSADFQAGAWEVSAMVRRYGRRRLKPVPPPTKPGGNVDSDSLMALLKQLPAILRAVKFITGDEGDKKLEALASGIENGLGSPFVLMLLEFFAKRFAGKEMASITEEEAVAALSEFVAEKQVV